MISSELPTLAQVQELLAQNGYEVSETDADVLRVRDVETGVAFQAVLQANVLYLSVTLVTVPEDAISPAIMLTMLAAGNGISTSSFQLYESGGKVAVTLNNFCTLQNMGAEDQDDVLSLAGYLMADLVEARELLESKLGSAAAG